MDLHGHGHGDDDGLTERVTRTGGAGRVQVEDGDRRPVFHQLAHEMVPEKAGRAREQVDGHLMPTQGAEQRRLIVSQCARLPRAGRGGSVSHGRQPGAQVGD